MTPSLRDRLLEQARPNEQLRAEHDLALRAMLESPLTPFRRVVTAACATLAFVLAIPMAVLAIQETGPVWMHLGLLLCALAPLNMGAILASSLRRGAWQRRFHGHWYVAHLAIFAWSFAALVLLKALAAPAAETLLPLIALAILMVIGLGVLPVILRRIQSCELAVRENLLRIELHMAESRDRPVR